MRKRIASTMLASLAAAALAAACDARPRSGSATSAAESATDSLAHPSSDERARATQDSINRAQHGYIVDSILPLEEEIARFTADLPSRPTRLANGADSRDALVRRWIDAVEHNDSLTLIRLAVNRPEFALLVYPSSPYTTPPRRQSPQLVWQQLSNASAQGFRRTIGRFGGKPLGVVDWSCPGAPEVQGDNRIWSDCRVRRVVAPGDTISQRMFGPIIARDGIFKFVTLATEM